MRGCWNLITIERQGRGISASVSVSVIAFHTRTHPLCKTWLSRSTHQHCSILARVRARGIVHLSVPMQLYVSHLTWAVSELQLQTSLTFQPLALVTIVSSMQYNVWPVSTASNLRIIYGLKIMVIRYYEQCYQSTEIFSHLYLEKLQHALTTIKAMKAERRWTQPSCYL